MLPSGLQALGIRTLRHVPDRLLSIGLPGRLRFDPWSVPTPEPRADAPVRLFVGPVNFAGQGWQWARALERNLPGVSAVSMAYSATSGYGFPIDIEVPASVYLLSGSWQRRHRAAVRSRFTHVILEAGRHLFGRAYDERVLDEIRDLQAGGVRVAMLTHGSDMRSPARHVAAHPDSPYGEWSLSPVLEAEAARNRALLDEAGVPIFASTPGMLADVPEAAWLPVVVDVERWAGGPTPLERARPVVVHLPSKAVVKGSDLIEPAVRRLHDEGLIEYRRVEGVPSSAVPGIFRDADIVLDQFRLGDYGVAACEAMAAGRVVVGNVDASVRETVRATYRRDLPIVESSASEVADVIRAIVADPARFRAVASDGAAFAHEVHDGRASARSAASFLGIDA
jgi:hypothetical protein